LKNATLATDDRDDGAPALAILEQDRRTISVIGRGFTHSFGRAGSPIQSVVTSPFAPHLGYVTDDGELTILSLELLQPLYRAQMQEPA
jgi:hypothetical protein